MTKKILIVLFLLLSLMPSVLADLTQFKASISHPITCGLLNKCVIYYPDDKTYTTKPYENKEFILYEKGSKVQGWDELSCSNSNCYCRELNILGADRCFVLTSAYSVCAGDVNKNSCENVPSAIGAFQPKDSNGIYGYIPLKEGVCYKTGTNDIFVDYCWEEGICKPCWAVIDRVGFSIIENSWDNSNINSPVSDKTSDTLAGLTYCEKYPSSLACNAFNDKESLTCSDGTKKLECSLELPLYCTIDGKLIQNAGVCGCPVGQKAHPDSSFNTCVDENLIKCYSYANSNQFSLVDSEWVCRKQFIKDWWSDFKKAILIKGGVVFLVVILLYFFRGYLLAQLKMLLKLVRFG